MVHTTMLRAFPENLRKTTETIIPRAPPGRTMFNDVSDGALPGPTSVPGEPWAVLGCRRGWAVWGQAVVPGVG